MLKKIVLTAAAVSLFAIPSIALSGGHGGSEISDLIQNAETDNLKMKSTYDENVVQGGNVALAGGKVRDIKQKISGDALKLKMEYATSVVQAANVIGATEIKGAKQKAEFGNAKMVSDSNYNSVQAINAASSCLTCE